MKIIRKLKSRAGFTLAEVLAAVLILLMVSGIVAAGIPSAKTAYDKAVRAANARVLLSTTVTALRNELGKADSITVEDSGTAVTYYSAETGSYSRIYLGSDPGKIMIQEYIDMDGNVMKVSVPNPEGGSTETAVAPRPLVSDTAATENLYICYDDSNAITWDESAGLITIAGLTVKDSSRSDREMASLDLLSIRVITASQGGE